MDELKQDVLDEASLSAVNGGVTQATLFPYEIQRGDTLLGIARRFGTSVVALQQINHIKDPNKIKAGAVIYIPQY